MGDQLHGIEDPLDRHDDPLPDPGHLDHRERLGFPAAVGKVNDAPLEDVVAVELDEQLAGIRQVDVADLEMHPAILELHPSAVLVVRVSSHALSRDWYAMALPAGEPARESRASSRFQRTLVRARESGSAEFDPALRKHASGPAGECRKALSGVRASFGAVRGGSGPVGPG